MLYYIDSLFRHIVLRGLAVKTCCITWTRYSDILFCVDSLFRQVLLYELAVQTCCIAWTRCSYMVYCMDYVVLRDIAIRSCGIA